MGISWGGGELDASCPAGFECDLKDTRVWRVYAGGRFNNAVELGALNIGDYGKAGAIYARTEVTGAPGIANFATGKERGSAAVSVSARRSDLPRCGRFARTGTVTSCLCRAARTGGAPKEKARVRGLLYFSLVSL